MTWNQVEEIFLKMLLFAEIILVLLMDFLVCYIDFNSNILRK